ncbi:MULTISPECIES: ABC transporter permease [Bordetella]|uniref:Iron(III)-transporter permease n=1 Tax=Bordetella genomosp. 6 TaxID=463024 RepID=A0ABX4FDL9_9BORD|nr:MULTISPECIES: iron ABC transporter permease [Bordetella]AOB28859.1 iron(III)-transporter permease [Bordetella bronchiseptica]ARP74798.1 iron(III)-transporter permease [Bordetella genomosp. 6]AZW46213.1 iron ABC transporter permease [Bordetella bronchiseptica]MBN3267112.1 iron ABC transporter permease [Bordetella bronchiseptica]OZI80301.1 iron(III)-transporter permease [Bordetella genomosp. 6]
MVAIFGLVSFLVVSLTVLPVLVLLLTAFRPQGKLWLDPAGFSLENFVNLASQPGLGQLISNTVIYVGGTIAIATFFATLWAWITERTDFRYKVTVRVLMILTLSLPSLIQGFGWVLLLNPSNGYINHLLRTWFDLETHNGPINIYSLGMMVLVSSFLLTPTIYVMLSGIIRNMDYKLEFPATLAGVSPWRILLRIVGPILLPGLLSVFIYTVMIMIQVFEIPLSIGLTGGIQVLSTRIYLLSTAELGAPDYNLAAAFGIVLVVIALFLVLLYQRLTRESEKFAVIGGKNFRLVARELGWRRHAVHGYAVAFFLLAFMPVLILLWASLLPFYTLPSIEALANVSFDNYRQLFSSALFQRSLSNTAIVVVLGSTLAICVSFLVAYVSVRPVNRWCRWLDVLSFLPIAIPNIVLGLAVLLLYVRTPIYGTIAAILLAQVVVNLVFGTRVISAALIQVHPDIERAAILSGVGRLRIMWRVLVPILRTQIFNGWLLVFAHGMRDVGIPLIFLTTKTAMLSSALWLLWGYPDVPGAAALSVVLIVLLAAVVMPLQVYMARVDERNS